MAAKKIVVERRVKKLLQVEVVKEQLQKCASQSLKSGRGTGWTFEVPSRFPAPRQDEVSGDLVYTIIIRFRTTSNRQSLLNKWPAICQRFAESACAGQLRGNPWKVIIPIEYGRVASDAELEHTKSEVLKVKADEPKELGRVNLKPGSNFNHIYGRRPQINRILAALRLAERTDWNKRTHSVLDGEPGCGKTEIMLSCAKMLGEEGRAWQWFDATSMTKAGALEQLIGSEVVPPVLFIEEIEKCEESALRWLLGVMDMRGMVRRTNYRVGNQAKNVRMVVIATANDVKLLKGMMSGALYSRFQNKIWCPRPDRTIMEKILVREMEDIGGKPEWVQATLKFGVDHWHMTDPRDLITICSCGGDDLLTGKYQRDYEATMHPLDREALRPEDAEDRDAAKDAEDDRDAA